METTSSFAQRLRGIAVGNGYSTLLDTIQRCVGAASHAAHLGQWETIVGPFGGPWHADKGNHSVLQLHLAMQELYLEEVVEESGSYLYVVAWHDEPDWERKERLKESSRSRRVRPRRPEDPVYQDYETRKSSWEKKQAEIVATDEFKEFLEVRAQGLAIKEGVTTLHGMAAECQRDKESRRQWKRVQEQLRLETDPSNVQARSITQHPAFRNIRIPMFAPTVDLLTRGQTVPRQQEEATSNASATTTTATQVKPQEDVVHSVGMTKAQMLAEKDRLLNADFATRAERSAKLLQACQPGDVFGPIREPAIGPKRVDLSQGSRSICRCGQSAFFPFCDMSHVKVNASLGTTFSPMRADQETMGKDSILVCSCGETKSRPECDGSCKELQVNKDLQNVVIQQPWEKAEEQTRLSKARQSTRITVDDIYGTYLEKWRDWIAAERSGAVTAPSSVVSTEERERREVLAALALTGADETERREAIETLGASVAQLDRERQDKREGSRQRLADAERELERITEELEVLCDESNHLIAAAAPQELADIRQRCDSKWEEIQTAARVSEQLGSKVWKEDLDQAQATHERFMGRITARYEELVSDTLKAKAEINLKRASLAIQQGSELELEDAEDRFRAMYKAAMLQIVEAHEGEWSELSQTLRRQCDSSFQAVVQAGERARDAGAPDWEDDVNRCASLRQSLLKSIAERDREENEEGEDREAAAAKRVLVEEEIERARAAEREVAEAEAAAANDNREADAIARAVADVAAAAAAFDSVAALDDQGGEATITSSAEDHRQLQAFEHTEQERIASVQRQAQEAATREDVARTALARDDLDAQERGRLQEQLRREQKEREMEERRLAHLEEEKKGAMTTFERSQATQREQLEQLKKMEEEQFALREKERAAVEKRAEEAKQRKEERRAAKKAAATTTPTTTTTTTSVGHATAQRMHAEQTAALASQSKYSFEHGDAARGAQLARNIQINTPETLRLHRSGAGSEFFRSVDAFGGGVRASPQLEGQRHMRTLSPEEVPLCVRFLKVAAERGSAPAFKFPRGAEWLPCSWNQYSDAVTRAAKSLIALGVKRGERVFIVSDSRPEWAIVSLATQIIGGVTVAAYPSSSAETLVSIVAEQLPIVFVTDDVGQMVKLQGRIGQVKHVVSINFKSEERRAVTWERFLVAGKEVKEKRLEGRIACVVPEDVAFINYTEHQQSSGSRNGDADESRGVVLTHGNELFAALSLTKAFECVAADRLLAFMPFCNATERVLSIYMPILTGAIVYYCDDLSKLHDHMSAVQPTLIFSAPILWERFEGVFRAKLAGKDVRALPGAVRKKLRKFIGCSRLRLGVSSMAHLHSSTVEFYRSLEIPLISVYTRACLSGVCTFEGAAYKGDPMSLGKALPQVEIKVSSDGQLLVRGPNVCHSFYGRKPHPPGTWFPTGDVGVIDEEGRVKLFGKLATRIRLEGTDAWISVEPIELELRSSRYLSGALVTADHSSKSRLVALLAVNRDAFKEMAEASQQSIADYAASAAALQLIDTHVQSVNRAAAAPHLQIKAYKVLPREFSVREGECSPAMQVNRAVCLEKFASLLQEM